MKLFCVILTLFALAPGARAQTDYRVAPRFEAPRSIDRVLLRVDAGEDEWIGEQDFEALNGKLKSISEQLKDGSTEFDPFSAQLKRFEKLQVVQLKIVRSDRIADSPEDVRIGLRVEFSGTNRGGGLLSLQGSATMDWRPENDDWRLLRTDVGALREVKAADFAFREITDQVFGGIESFQKQLSKDTDYWRGELDAAVGVQVYGHHGVSLVDYDSDGLDDIYVSQPAGLPNRLYRNNGDLTFADVSRGSGLDILDDTSMSLFGDLDNDGDQDVVLIGADPLLFRNVDGRFAYEPDSGLAVGLSNGAMLTGASFADYDLDGDLDLYVCAYDFWQAGSEYDAPTPYYDATNGPPNLLFRNLGDGTFEEVAAEAGLEKGNDRFSFAASWADYDSDGDPDLYVANDFGRNNLYRNEGDGTFSDVAEEAGVEDLGAGMSVSWGDYDGDGFQDLYVSNMWSSAGQRVTSNRQFEQVARVDDVRAKFQRQARGNSLFRNNGDGTFVDVSESTDVTMGRWAWGSELVDLDSDGRLDIFVQNGYITGERLDDL